MTIATRVVGSMERIGNHLASGAGAFSSLAGTPTNPTAVTLTIRKPDGVHLIYGWPTAGASGTLVQEASQTGRFYVDQLLDQAGDWTYHLVGTGAVTAAAQGFLVVARDWTA